MVYFISDAHLGLYGYEQSRKREKLLVDLLTKIQDDAQKIFLLGDIFEFWWEWPDVVPKYYVRFLGKLAELVDKGVEVYYFYGNHDLWVKDYFDKEIGLKIFGKPSVLNINGKNFYIAHGDGLGPSDKGYKFFKKIVSNRFFYKFFTHCVHPNLVFKIVKIISHKREQKKLKFTFKGEKEWLIVHSQQILKSMPDVDFFIYGHRHIPYVWNIENSKVVVIGDWLVNFTYAVFDGKDISIKKYEE